MKLPTNANHVKVPLSALRITGNVRKNFDPEDIERLAKSIRQDGLMNPITVRPPVEDANGNKTYEVIAGGRRIRAHQWLCDHGDDFALIECCVRTGDTWTLQMIENIQRTDLSPREKEEAVAAALDSGMTMIQIAEKLCKPISYVSDIVAGMKVRKAADEAGIDTETISTKALSQLRSIPEESRADALEQLVESGGTFREATRVMHEYKKPAPATGDESAQETPTTYVSSKADTTTTDDERFAPGAIVSDIGERLFFADLKVGMKFVHGDKTCAMYAKVCEVIWMDDESMQYVDEKYRGNPFSTRREYIDSKINEHNDWIYAIPMQDETIDPFEIESESPDPAPTIFPKKKPEAFNWYIKDSARMQDALLALPQKMKKMPAGTEICVQAGCKIASISSVVYEPENNRLIFRSLDDFGIHA